MIKPVFIVAAPCAGAAVLTDALCLPEADPFSISGDARYIYLYREPADSIAAIMDAWRSGASVSHPDLPGWTGLPWSLALVPDWQNLIGRDLTDVAVAQWERINRHILESLPDDGWCATSYEALMKDRHTELTRLARFAGTTFRDVVIEPAPVNPDAWRSIMPRMSQLTQTKNRARIICATSAAVGARESGSRL